MGESPIPPRMVRHTVIDEPPESQVGVSGGSKGTMAIQDTAVAQKLQDLLDRLFGDEDEYEKFEQDPEQYLLDEGLGDIGP